MLFARQLVVNASAAYGLQAIDLVRDIYISWEKEKLNIVIGLCRFQR